MKSPAKPPSTPLRLLAAIDVSAAELVVALCPEDADTSPPAKTTVFANTPAGHRALIKVLTAKGTCARVILEATGVYSDLSSKTRIGLS